MPRGRWRHLAAIYLIFKTRKHSRKFLESAKRSRPRSKNWPALENSNTSKNYGRNFRRRFSSCFRFPDSARRRSKRSTSNCTSVRSNNYGKRANLGGSRDCPALAKRPRQRFAPQSSNARNIRDIFNLARLRLKQKRYEQIWRPIPMRSRSMLLEVTGSEGKLCVTSILSWQRKSRRRLRNSSSNTRWRNRSLSRGRQKRVWDFGSDSSAICERLPRQTIRLHSITLRSTRNRIAKCAA